MMSRFSIQRGGRGTGGAERGPDGGESEEEEEQEEEEEEISDEDYDTDLELGGKEGRFKDKMVFEVNHGLKPSDMKETRRSLDEV
ncbi:hypothetical protein EYF80_058307 [Liparis tanakae]|uniref:Uncharacterized protein n=1 Tax=Liparis tanakae TaxID=230148 RepID=A0A4Z2ERJ8_9TELE|nr:hypothetical protein EYF80_058307 [Liparis tanakae]